MNYINHEQHVQNVRNKTAYLPWSRPLGGKQILGRLVIKSSDLGSSCNVIMQEGGGGGEKRMACCCP